jgi:hypothetical protein
MIIRESLSPAPCSLAEAVMISALGAADQRARAALHIL